MSEERNKTFYNFERTWFFIRDEYIRMQSELESLKRQLATRDAEHDSLAGMQEIAIEALNRERAMLVEALTASDELLRSLPNSGNFYGLAVMENNATVLSATEPQATQWLEDKKGEWLEQLAKYCGYGEVTGAEMLRMASELRLAESKRKEQKEEVSK